MGYERKRMMKGKREFDKGAYIPSQEEIERKTAEIQATWTRAIEKKRRAWFSSPVELKQFHKVKTGWEIIGEE